MPTINKMIFIKKKITYLLEEIVISAELIAAGIPEYAITKDIAEDAEIRNRITPLVHALFNKICIKDFIVMLL